MAHEFLLRYAALMHVCVLLPVLDEYKGGNHLPLFAACSDVQFTVLCHHTKPRDIKLPPNVRLQIIGGRIGPYSYGIADALFALRVLAHYPPSHSFWRQFDVLHFNQTLSPFLLRLRAAGIPLLYTIHHPVTADREIAVRETGSFSSLRWWLFYALPIAGQRRLCRGMPFLMTVSETMRTRIALDYGCAKEKIHVVPNGVDGEAFHPVSDAECRFDVVSLGSYLHPRKGFPYLLDVYKRIAASGKSIADVGKRSDEQRSALQTIKGVTIFGTVDSDVLADIVRHSRVLVSTSLFEGFGLSLVEALACGHPAFAFAVGAVPEVLGSIDASLVATPRDTAAMARNIEAFLTLSSEERERCGVRYREEVLRRYPLKASAAALQRLYHIMVQN